jgi:hypothetical protein
VNSDKAFNASKAIQQIIETILMFTEIFIPLLPEPVCPRTERGKIHRLIPGMDRIPPRRMAPRGVVRQNLGVSSISGSAAGWGAGSRRRPPLRRDRKFESVSLQRGVSANLIADDLRMALIDLRPYSCASQRHRRKWDREFESGLLQGRVHCEIRSRSRGSSYRVGPT